MNYRFDSLRRSIVQFLNIFNNIKVNKYDDDGNITREVSVPLKLAGKQKFYYWLHDRKHARRFPMMAGGVRAITPIISDKGINQKLPFLNEKLSDEIRSPVPYNIDFELSIVANYVDEAHQVLEQILPFFGPYCMTTVNIPEIDVKFDMKVLLMDVAQDYEFSMPEDDYRMMSWILNFTATTYMFKPVQAPHIIKSINLDFYGREKLKEKVRINEEGDINITNYEEIYGLGNYAEEEE